MRACVDIKTYSAVHCTHISLHNFITNESWVEGDRVSETNETGSEDERVELD